MRQASVERPGGDRPHRTGLGAARAGHLGRHVGTTSLLRHGKMYFAEMYSGDLMSLNRKKT